MLNFIRHKILSSIPPHKQREIRLVCKSLDVGAMAGFAENKLTVSRETENFQQL